MILVQYTAYLTAAIVMILNVLEGDSPIASIIRRDISRGPSASAVCLVVTVIGG